MAKSNFSALDSVTIAETKTRNETRRKAALAKDTAQIVRQKRTI